MRRSTARLFAVYAVVSLIPIVALGLILAAHFRREAQQRGVAQARSEAQLIARSAIEPVLGPWPVSHGISPGEQVDLWRLVDSSVNPRGEGVLRLRLRDLSGRVVFSDDATGLHGPPDDEARDAARGETIAELTNLGADATDGHTRGQRAVEVYVPLTAGRPASRVGVLELYLSYEPIHRETSHLLSMLYRDLIVGLGLLYLALFAITASVSQRLRREFSLNAYLAEHDPLTGLPNRARFQARVGDALVEARRRGGAVAIAIVDLDRFKDINDTLGHRNGDEVLTELARRLSAGAAAWGGATVARLGGDEFGIVLPLAGDPEPVLHTVRHVIESSLQVDGLTLSVQASIGYVVAPDDAQDVDTLMRRADVAMYVTKADHSGVGRYDPRHDQYDASTLQLVAELREGIDSDQLVLHYQPQRYSASGRTTGVEALVRWQHPTRGLLSPDTFLPLAEQTDLIDQLTSWVVRRALADLQALGAPAAHMSVAVNVSARSIGRGALADDVIRALRHMSVDPARLVIEMTETAILADPAGAAAELGRLAEAGVSISLDDFGQGHTSLGHLSALPLDELKIDRGFVSDMLEKPADAAIVHSVIDLGHNLGLRVVAEGVEDRAVADHLRDRGCDLLQGYLVARPMSFDALVAWLAADRAARSRSAMRHEPLGLTA